MGFRGVVELNGRTATGVEVPVEVVEGLGSGRKPAVHVTLNGYRYRSSVATVSGRFMIPVSAQVRADAGVAAGDTVDVELELDTEPRTVTVPDDLAAALDREPTARAAFDRLAYSHRQRYVLSVEGARTAETRQRRVDKAVADLRQP